MSRWPGQYETSDLEYNNTTGAFTSLLVEKGHLPSTSWQGRTPKYYIEVKSTPYGLRAPFYMSGPQYSKVRFIPNHYQQPWGVRTGY